MQSAADMLAKGAKIYATLGTALGGAPWFFVGALHLMESTCNFNTHLHNGDPLSARTTHKPAGKPKAGNPPFTWQQSAADALSRFAGATDWSLGRILDRWEAYNGLGYRNRGLPSPYLWSGSDQWEKGKFVGDGDFDPEAGSDQIGAAVVLKRLVSQGLVTLDAASGATAGEAVLGLQVGDATLPTTIDIRSAQDELAFPGPLDQGARGIGVRRVQEWCSFDGAQTKIDGDFGSGTHDALVVFQNQNGIPATGNFDLRTWSALTAPLHRALAPVAAEGKSLHEMVLAVAAQHLAEKPIELGGDNRGAWVRLYMDGMDGSEMAWCAGFVCFILQQACLGLGRSMPIKRRVGVDELVGDAKAGGRFIDGDALPTADARLSRVPAGSLFALRGSAAGDWIHTGLVTQAGGDAFRTIEGNTNTDGSRNGFEVIARSRSYRSVDFILLA